MTLLAGEKLDKDRFFRSGAPVRQGSSFDLTIGHIYDEHGHRVQAPYTLLPNEMIQVVSAEVFDLPSNVTAHVSYKTGLTSQGIWALTVGIVDPGWNGPVSTTLLNFSKAKFAVQEGDVFLRVSFFEHDEVNKKYLRPNAAGFLGYIRSVQGTAATRFPREFLDVDRVSGIAADKAIKRMQNQALVWVALIAFLFTVLQLAVSWVAPRIDGTYSNTELLYEVENLKAEMQELHNQH